MAGGGNDAAVFVHAAVAGAFVASICLMVVRPIVCRASSHAADPCSTCSMFSSFEFSATIDSCVEKSKSMNGCKTLRPFTASCSSKSLKCVAHSLAVSFTTAAQWSRSLSTRAISSVSWLFVERLYASSNIRSSERRQACLNGRVVTNVDKVKAVHSAFCSSFSVWNLCSSVSTSAILTLNARMAA